MLDRIRPVSSSLEYSFVPEEVCRALTCASSSLGSPDLQSHRKTKNIEGVRVNRLWHYPNRRSKYRHLTDHPVSLTGAGRKPGGRLEVIQLTEAMDSMLEKAGVDELIAVTGPSQLHNMLELMKAEQNIYNIVFHELIRQVSVDCMERGQLLSKLRSSFHFAQTSLHLAEQRPLGWSKFIEAVPCCFSELYEIRERDCRVTKEAEKAQEELAAAMREAQANANLLEQYRELYELQRRRLEEQVLAVARERDIWSSAACDLALKIRIVTIFLLFPIQWPQDLRDLADLQEETEQFKGILGHVGSEIEHLEESSKEKLQLVCRSLNKWLQDGV
uniref:Axonemal dynein light chain domain containing 1 n=1 Tax=Coturnix japonica TaxID=93934 RepID=A0A8C2YHT5_COTJA